MKLKSTKYVTGLTAAFLPVFNELAGAGVPFNVMLIFCISLWLWMLVEFGLDLARILTGRFGPAKDKPPAPPPAG